MKVKRIGLAVGAVLIALGIYFRLAIYPQLDLISGFAAKSVASCHFIDGRSAAQIRAEDNDIPKVNWYSEQVDEAAKKVMANVYGLKPRTAIYRPGLGATLVEDLSQPIDQTVPQRTQPSLADKDFPYGDRNPIDKTIKGVDYAKLQQAVDWAFDAENAKGKRSRAVVVIYKDKVIAEKYAKGYTEKSKLLGWSMTKSITATYYGILAQQNRLKLTDRLNIPSWNTDRRHCIQLQHLLQMNSGLEWEERYDKICDATLMLFQNPKMSTAQMNKPLLYQPLTHWNYSSGTTNLLSAYLENYFPTHQDYMNFWYSGLLDRIGMYSALVEVDPSGHYVGSSYSWATGRDWGKFGLLYLHQGNWNGDQVFSPDWVRFVTTPTPTSNGHYGGHFWLNAGGFFPDVPRNMYYCSGFQGQMVAVFPTADLVVVRLGLVENPKFDGNRFFKQILDAVHPK